MSRLLSVIRVAAAAVLIIHAANAQMDTEARGQAALAGKAAAQALATGVNSAGGTPTADAALAQGRSLSAQAQDVFNVKNKPYLAKGDLLFYNSTFSVSSGSETLTASSAVFGGVTTGQTIVLPQPGASPPYLITTVTPVDTTHITLGAPAIAALSAFADTALPIGSDDTASINAAKTACVSNRWGPDVSGNYVGQCELSFPAGNYLTLNGLNFSGIRQFGTQIVGHGAVIYGATAGYPVFDGLNSRFLRINNLTIEGDCYAEPNVGLILGRISSASADFHNVKNIKFSGCYTISDFFNNATENSYFEGMQGGNADTSPNSYGAIWDGIGYWKPQSHYQTIAQTTGTFVSFKSNRCRTCNFAGYGLAPVWTAGSEELVLDGQYPLGESTSGTQYGVEVYTANATVPTKQFEFDAHIEAPANGLTCAIFITGPYATPTIYSLRYADMMTHSSQSYICHDTNITQVGLPDLHLNVIADQLSPTVLDTPSIYTVSGTNIFVPSPATWNVTNFSGIWADAQTGTHNSLPQPSALLASSVVSQGGVNGIVAAGNGTYYVQNGLTYTPTVTIAPPGGSGATALATITGFNFYGGLPAGGTGYTNNDTCAAVDANGNKLFNMKIAVTSGAITAQSALTNKAIPSSIPEGPIAVTNCADGGGGATYGSTMNYRPYTFSITNAGGPYTAPPVATFSSQYQQGSFSGSYASLSNSLLLQGGLTITLTSAGISLGGHTSFSGSSPAVSACGASPSVDPNATDESGTITPGTGSPTACTLTFVNPLTGFGHCRATSETGQTIGYSKSLAALTITGSALTGPIDYACDGQ